MPTNRIDLQAVREIALALPNVEEGTLHGAPSWKASGRLLAWPALHKSAEPDSLVVRIDCEERRALLAAEPDVFYMTDHYIKHPAILVRLSRIRRELLRSLLSTAWRSANSKRKQAANRRRAATSSRRAG